MLGDKHFSKKVIAAFKRDVLAGVSVADIVKKYNASTTTVLKNTKKQRATMGTSKLVIMTRNKNVVNDYISGLSIAELCEKYNITTIKAKRITWLHRHTRGDVANCGIKPEWRKEKVADAILEAKLTHIKIAELFSVSSDQVHYLSKQLIIAGRKPHRYKKMNLPAFVERQAKESSFGSLFTDLARNTH